MLESVFTSGFSLQKCYPVQSETRTGAHTSNKNSIGIDLMLVCQKVTLTPTQMTMITEQIINEALDETRKYLVRELDKFQKVEAEFTILDIQNIAIAEFFVAIKNYHLYDITSKHIIIEKLQRFLNNIEEVSGNFEITKKRNGWWSELYRQKWDINS